MNSKIRKAIEQYELFSVSMKELQKKADKRREYIKGYVLKNGKIEYNGVTCFPTTRVKIIYDIKKIKERFRRGVWRLFVDDVVHIETSFFVSKCRELGIDEKEFLKKGKYERVVSVNEAKLSKLTDSGEVTFEQLKGCYTSEENTSITIRIG